MYSYIFSFAKLLLLKTHQMSFIYYLFSRPVLCCMNLDTFACLITMFFIEYFFSHSHQLHQINKNSNFESITCPIDSELQSNWNHVTSASICVGPPSDTNEFTFCRKFNHQMFIAAVECLYFFKYRRSSGLIFFSTPYIELSRLNL